MKLTSKMASGVQRVLGFGGPKSGKTELAARLSEFYRLVFFDLENGYSTMRKLPLDWQERIDLISIPDTRIYPIASETMLKVIRGTQQEICMLHAKVNCGLCNKSGGHFEIVNLSKCGPNHIVVIDSLTQMANSVMAHITKLQPDDYKPTWEDYRSQGTLMDLFLSQIQQAPFNIICLTHEIEAELEDGRKKLVPIAGTTNFSRNTAKYFDHVVYCELNSKKHKFGSSTTYSANVLTGSRTDVAIEKEETASLFTIFPRRVPDATDPDGPVQTIHKDPAPATVANPVAAKGKTPGEIALENLMREKEKSK